MLILQNAQDDAIVLLPDCAEQPRPKNTSFKRTAILVMDVSHKYVGAHLAPAMIHQDSDLRLHLDRSAALSISLHC